MFVTMVVTVILILDVVLDLAVILIADVTVIVDVAVAVTVILIAAVDVVVMMAVVVTVLGADNLHASHRVGIFTYSFFVYYTAIFIFSYIY